ncbi:hypothetical protein, partial [Candidatus Cyanaurora vandensis]
LRRQALGPRVDPASTTILELAPQSTERLHLMPARGYRCRLIPRAGDFTARAYNLAPSGPDEPTYEPEPLADSVVETQDLVLKTVAAPEGSVTVLELTNPAGLPLNLSVNCN